MKRVLSKSLPWLMCAIAAVQGYWLWRTRHPKVNPAPQTSPVAERAAGASELARFAFFADSSLPCQTRVAMLRQLLAESCSPGDVAALYHLLLNTKTPSARDESWFVLANDLMGQIALHDTDPERFVRRFTAYLGDGSRHPVLRDYAVQHLAAWLDPHRSVPASSVTPRQGWPALRESVLEAIARAATDPALSDTSVPGTALMAVANLYRHHPDECGKAFSRLRPWLVSALGENSSVSVPIRVSAINAAACSSPGEFLPVFRSIASRPSTHPAVRLAAIHAIGRLGTSSDLKMMEQISSSYPALARGTASAIRQLKLRSGS